MPIDIVIESGAPNPEVVADPTPDDGTETQRLTSINGKLDAILAALGVSYEEEKSDQE